MVVALDVLDIPILHVNAVPEFDILACLFDNSGGLGKTNHHSVFDESVAAHH
jgi:hypothetical protein